VTRLRRLLTAAGTVDELRARIDELERQVAHLTALIEHPTWPEDYRHRRARQAVDRLTDGRSTT